MFKLREFLKASTPQAILQMTRRLAAWQPTYPGGYRIWDDAIYNSTGHSYLQNFFQGA